MNVAAHKSNDNDTVAQTEYRGDDVLKFVVTSPTADLPPAIDVEVHCRCAKEKKRTTKVGEALQRVEEK